MSVRIEARDEVIPDAAQETDFQRLAREHAAAKRKRVEDADEVGIDLRVEQRTRDPEDAERSLQRRPDLKRRMALLEGKKARSTRDHFDPLAFEEHLRERGVLRDDWVIHDHRASRDPFYALWFFPKTKVITYDEASGEQREEQFLDKVVRDCMEFYEQRCGEALTEDTRTSV